MVPNLSVAPALDVHRCQKLFKYTMNFDPGVQVPIPTGAIPTSTIPTVPIPTCHYP